MTWGSRGDFQPYLALARGFTRAGHDVRIAAPDVASFRDAAAEQGVPFVAAGGRIDPDEVARFLDSVVRGSDPIRQVRRIIEIHMAPSIEAAYAATLDHARWSDVVVSHFFQPAGRMVAEAAGRPWVSGSLAPMLPTAAYPPPLVPDLGRVLNRAAWWILARYMNAQWSPAVNRARTRMGLPPFRDLYRRDFFSPYLDLVGVSRYVARRPQDWPRPTRVTGYWILERPDWSPPPALAAFLAAGPGPIALGFGSMTTEDRAGLTRTVVEAVRRTGERVVLQSGWAELGGDDLPPSVFVAGDVPHDWLFPRVRAVVHHGGAGTTAAVFRGGVPGVVVPHIADQRMWAGIAKRLGVTPASILRPDLTPERLARAIVATRDPAMASRAARLGELIRGEDGVGEAVRLVERGDRGWHPLSPTYG